MRHIWELSPPFTSLRTTLVPVTSHLLKDYAIIFICWLVGLFVCQGEAVSETNFWPLQQIKELMMWFFQQPSMSIPIIHLGTVEMLSRWNVSLID